MAKLGAPLKSWDIFIEAYWRSMDDARDVAAIKRLGIRCSWREMPDVHRKLVKEQWSVLVTDLQEDIVFASQNIYLLTGLAPDQLIGNNLAIFKTGENAQRNYTLETQPVFDTLGSHTHYMVFLR